MPPRQQPPPPYRESLRFKRGRIRLPRTLRKVCVHGGPADLELRFRGDMSFEQEWYVGRTREIYTCIACGYTKGASDLFDAIQAYILHGTPFVVGRNIR